MLQKLRQRYPQVALISELVQIDHGKYIVKAIVEIEGKTVVTGLAAADTVEIAEDRARERALLLLEAESTPDLQLVEKISPNNISLPEDLPKPVASAKKSTKTAKVTEIPRPEAKIEPELPQVKDIPPAKIEPELPQVKDIPPAKIEPELPQVKDIPLPEPEPLLLEMETDNYSLLSELPEEASLTEEETPAPAPVVVIPEEIDYSVLKTKIDVEMKRLAWTTEKGREYLISTYGKKSRLLLTNEELLEFYNYLSSISA
ncbi:hypothetical protein [Microcystis aeruginosa]|uniref:Uncharacterized protein n=2 Tax=Microcystis TaxID=1125 RepID=A0A552I4G2_MICVR|nr:hypothetical protein [Microcystis aeruginosa]TRU70675.1 MAG: hypothetical protein EWV55_18805 [Microcystis viridis Mv_BB_P_19951000_S69]TRU76966.1 MAG: hypothetical protein EWV47_05225 [Microcystis viridis Mv_BB_P_19951000_S68]TRU78373.1 MAG: hypothetical protein EWV77_04400 [Microcystis viridis Mv_BB_P_19951000_S68D]TRU80576.1 MAG: hypothetical protein EWV46_23295 [Microcystis viridis Mv_BB_P_19951000_S69D]QGZ91110.1 hypothetical protein GQR42_17980 [Microcystis aeruginosa FD4]